MTKNMTDKERWGCVLTILLGPVALVGATILRGWVLAKLWGWFIVSLGVPAIGVAQAIGISGLIAMLTYEGSQPSQKSDEELNTLLIKGAVVMFATPLMYLAFGWLVLWASR